MRKVLTGLLILGWIFSTWVSLAHAQADFSRYKISVAFDPTRQTLSGNLVLDYFNDTGQTLDTVTFWLLGNLAREPDPYVHPAYLDPRNTRKNAQR